MSTEEVLFEEMIGSSGNVGVITLNKPKSLNSLTHHMIESIHANLKIWATAKHIKAVVIRAVEGRAFCAGGDLRLTHDRHQEKHPELANFFRDEYQLNRFIFHFPKPYIAFLDGITMGGGVGISIHGSHRVATEKLLFAMPETGIGFFPDVGGTYFLPRLSGKLGYYLGLSGARIATDDAVALGIAQHKVSSYTLPLLLNAIAQQPFGADAKASVTAIISQFEEPVQSPTLLDHRETIDACFSADSMEKILQLTEKSSSEVCQKAAEHLKKKSPTSLKVTLRAFEMAKQMDFDACMHQEFRLTSHFLQGHDFLEGIRAVIIEKHQNPQWQPDSLAKVSTSEVDTYFAPLEEELAI